MIAVKSKTVGITKDIIKLAIPAMIMQVINTLYTIVDKIFIGNSGTAGSSALAGIGICYPILTLIVACSQLFAVGGSTMTSIYLGNEDEKSAEIVIGNVFATMSTSAAILFIILYIFKAQILDCFGANEETIIYATRYLRIYLFGIFFQLFLPAFSSILICQGYAIKSMCICLIGAVINIVLDYFFIVIINMGIEGAAVSTIISQMIASTLVCMFLFNKKDGLKKLRLRRENVLINREKTKAVFVCGIASFTMSLTEVCIHVAYNRSLLIYGSDSYIATMAIIQSLMQFIYVFSNGLTQAVQPTISYYYGANDSNGVRIAYRTGMLIHVIIAVGCSGLLILTRNHTVRLFTDDSDVIEAAVKAVPIYLLGWGILGIQSGVQCTFVGLGKAKYSMFLAILRKIILLIPLMIILPGFLGVKGIFLAEAISDSISGVTAGILFLCLRKHIMAPIGKRSYYL